MSISNPHIDMKLNNIPSLLALAISLLFGYGFYAVAGDDPNAALAFMGGSICLFVILFVSMGLSYEDGRKGVSLQVLGFSSAIVMLISQFAFALFGIRTNAYIIVNGIILLLFLSIYYAIYRCRQD